MKNESSLNRNIQSALIISQIPLIWLLSFISIFKVSDFSKHFLLPRFGSKNSIINWVSKFNLSSFSFQLPIFHWQFRSSTPNTLSTRKAIQRRIYFQCFLLWKCVLQQSSRFQIANLQPFIDHHGAPLSVTNQNIE